MSTSDHASCSAKLSAEKLLGNTPALSNAMLLLTCCCLLVQGSLQATVRVPALVDQACYQRHSSYRHLLNMEVPTAHMRMATHASAHLASTPSHAQFIVKGTGKQMASVMAPATMEQEHYLRGTTSHSQPCMKATTVKLLMVTLEALWPVKTLSHVPSTVLGRLYWLRMAHVQEPVVVVLAQDLRCLSSMCQHSMVE